MHKLYVWIDGENFDPDKFIETSGIKGSVGIRKRVNDGVVEESGKYWMSDVLEVKSRHPEDHLEEFIKSLSTALKNVKDSRIVAEIVFEYQNEDEVKGFYISEKTISLLSDIGASLDIDVIKV